MPITKPIPGSDYEIVSTPRPYAVALIHGDTGTGKTTVVTDYCPGPVHLINFDGRSDVPIARALSRGRNVLRAHIPCPIGSAKMPEDEAKRIARAAFDRVVHNLEISSRAVEKGDCRTIALDTGTELSEIMAISINGKFEPVKGDYGKSKDSLNLLWRKILIDMRKLPCHFVILARSQEVWINNQPTGAFKPRGPAVMEEGSDFAMQIRRKGTGKAVRFDVKVTNPKLDVSQMGEVYTPEMWGDMGPFLFTCLMQGMAVDLAL